MHYIERRFEFDTAHRVYQHESKCRNLHGHRYVLLVTLCHNRLDELGRVLDFSEVKSILGEWIDLFWDHNTILKKEDPLVEHINGFTANDWDMKTPYVMEGNPTAENMASHFADVARTLLDNNELKWLDVHKVQLYETPNCSATYYPTGRKE